MKELARRLSLLFINRVILLRAGRSRNPFAVLHHVGRKSGREYRIPVMIVRTGKYFIIPLPYGDEVNWCQNVLTASHCNIRWRDELYEGVHPQLLPSTLVIERLPRLARRLQSWAGTRYYLMVKAANPRVSR